MTEHWAGIVRSMKLNDLVVLSCGRHYKRRDGYLKCSTQMLLLRTAEVQHLRFHAVHVGGRINGPPGQIVAGRVWDLVRAYSRGIRQ